MVKSNWKITYDPSGAPLVLVDFGAKIGEEIEIPWTQLVQDSKRLRAANAKYFGRGNVENGLTFSVFKDHANDATARNWMLTHAIALPALVTKTLKLEVAGSGGFLMAEAVIRSAPSRMVTAAPVARTMTTYTITGGGWSVIP
jgi:hypothetical protein